jgi:hypothetical protein
MDLFIGLAAGGFGGIIVGDRFFQALGLVAISASIAVYYLAF